jgi:KTSC domain
VPPTMREVHSSHVTAVGHDPETNELHVAWDTGRTSIYSNVPAAMAHQVANSWSIGKALTEQVKNGKHPHRYA